MDENIKNLLDTEHTIAKEIFENITYPHEVIPKIKEYIIEKGKQLPVDKFDETEENIWIAKSAKIDETAHISAPCIIDENAEIRHSAFIRGSVIVGKNSVVGNSTEVKNSILFDNVQVPHYNYVGDSVLGYKSHFGAGAITSNVKNDKTDVKIDYGANKIESGYRKLGAIVGNFAEIGCGSVLNPGTVVGCNTNIYPLSSIRGYIGENKIYKSSGEITIKR